MWPNWADACFADEGLARLSKPVCEALPGSLMIRVCLPLKAGVLSDVARIEQKPVLQKPVLQTKES
jgi:hypothetical protein